MNYPALRFNRLKDAVAEDAFVDSLLVRRDEVGSMLQVLPW